MLRGVEADSNKKESAPGRCAGVREDRAAAVDRATRFEGLVYTARSDGGAARSRRLERRRGEDQHLGRLLGRGMTRSRRQKEEKRRNARQESGCEYGKADVQAERRAASWLPAQKRMGRRAREEGQGDRVL